MRLNDKIVASYVEGFSGVNIYCDKSLNENIIEKFNSMFEEAWNQAMDDVEEEYDAECEEKVEEYGAPATAMLKDDKVFIEIGPLFLTLNYGARVDNEFGPEAFEKTINALKQEYPNIEYEGVIAYEWCDEHGADVVNYEICSEPIIESNEKKYDFIGDALNYVLSGELEEGFWEKISDQLFGADEDDFKSIIHDFRVYDVPQSAIDRIEEIARENGFVLDSN